MVATPMTRLAENEQHMTRGRGLRWLAALVLGLHGLVHLLGVPLQWRLAQPGGLRYADAHPAPGTPAGILAGVGWLVAGLLFLAAAFLLVRARPRWRQVAVVAVVVSVPVLVLNSRTAAVGLVVDAAVLFGCALSWRRR